MSEIGIVVGQIENHDVIYIAERDTVFCKNTTMPYRVMKRFMQGPMWREEFPEKKLHVEKDGALVSFGCLRTTLSNCNDIIKTIENSSKQQPKKQRYG